MRPDGWGPTCVPQVGKPGAHTVLAPAVPEDVLAELTGKRVGPGDSHVHSGGRYN